jgi:hypothetical protein
MKNDFFNLKETSKIRSISLTLKEGDTEELQTILKVPFTKHIDFLGFEKERVSVILVYQKNDINYGCGFSGEVRNVVKEVYKKLLDSESIYMLISSPKAKEEWFVQKEIIK